MSTTSSSRSTCRTAEMEGDATVTLGLAEQVTANGVVRSDTIRTQGRRKVRMGFYALPELGQPIAVTETKVKSQLIMARSTGKH